MKAISIFLVLLMISSRFLYSSESTLRCSYQLLKKKLSNQKGPALAEIQLRYNALIKSNADLLLEIIQSSERSKLYFQIQESWLEKYLENELTHPELGDKSIHHEKVDSSMTEKKLTQKIIDQIQSQQLPLAGILKLLEIAKDVLEEIEIKDEKILSKVKAVQKENSKYLNWITEEHLFLCDIVARQSKAYKMSFDDKVMHGFAGLWRAAEKFDPNLGVQFATYAKYWVEMSLSRSEMKYSDVFVASDSVEKLTKLKQVRGKLTQKLNRFPTIAELSEETGLSMARVEELLFAEKASIVAKPLDAPILPNGDLNYADILAAYDADPIELQAKKSSLKKIRDALFLLSPKERQVIEFIYLNSNPNNMDLDNTSIGKRLGVSRSRIQQLEASALKKLRAHLIPIADH